MIKKIMLIIACTMISVTLNAADQKPTMNISARGTLPSLPVEHKVEIKADAFAQAFIQALKEMKLDVKPEVTVKATDLVEAARAMALNANLNHQLQVNAPEHPAFVKIDIPTQDIKDATNHICDRTEELLIKSATCTFAWSLSHSISNPCCLLCGLGGVAYILITPVNTLKKTPVYLMEQLNRCRAPKPQNPHFN
jgi:hypothetical protein